ncbi:coiled coil-containing protein [Cryptosporidium canis]|uniref:Coiled coil-containing protein n=1 Tax=Cryptosporidium canis TaxID=195482 RepID=A0ABQ8P5X6_9CRYT|nr:coiled coil-containing protein [Cryptosporidium canis]
MSLSLAIANLGVELYISGVREFELPSEENATNSTVNCICVLWLPYEDPLEIFGLQQGIRWDPILGRRCTGIAVARPCTKPGKISSLECDFTTYIHALNVARVKYVHNKEVKAVSGDSEADSDENSESEKPIENMIGCAKFEDAIKFAVEFPHMHCNKTEHEHGKFCTYNPRLDIVDRLLASEEGHQEPIPIFISLGYISENSQNSRVFRPATKWRRPMNAIGDGEYNLEDSNPIKWIGTAVLTKEDWIRSYSSGRVFPVKLLPHYQLMSMVTNYRKQILDENNAIDGEERESFITSLMSDIEKFKLNMFSSRSNQQSRIHPPDEKYDEYGIIQVQLRTFISYPIRTEGSLKPLASVYHRQDLKDQFCLASLCYIDVLLLENVPAWSDIDIWDIAHSSIHICVVWKHERRILHEGGNALELFPYRCVKINGLPKNMEFSDINTIKEKNMRMKCLFSGRVLMTPVPGSEPSIYIYMLLNGRPFSCIRNPISMRDFEPETSNHDKYFDMDRLDTNVESVLKEFEARGRFSGTLKCKVNVWPDKSRFLSRKEYSYLNLRPQKGIVYNILHDYQTKMPDHYSAPTLGPYGVWVGYTVNDKSDELINSQKFKNLFDEAIHRINSTARGEKLFAPIEDQSDDRQGFEDECGLGHNYTNPKHMVDSALEDAQALDEEYVNGDLKRFNHDRRSSKPYVPHMSTLLGQGIRPAVAGEWITFTIQSRDEDGNKSIFGNSKIHIRLRSVGYIKYTFTAEPYGLEFNRRDSDALISANESEVCKVGIDQMDVPIEWCSVESYHGVYNCRMKCERSGQYLLRITMDGLSIAGSPYDLIITPSTPEAKASSTIGEGTFKCRACPSVEYMMNIESIKACNGRVPRYINSFIVILCDEFGNRISTGGHQLKAKCNSSIGKIHKIYDNWDGSYVVYYTVHLERTIQSVGQKVIDKIHMSCNKSSWSQFRHDKLASQTTTTRAIEQALGINTRVTESKIDFNSEELGGLFNTKKIQHMTSFDYGDEEFLDSEEKIISSICDLEICVYLDNKPIYGSPFTPYIENLVEIRDWYKFVDLNSSESTERKFEKLLESDDFEGAIKLMKVLEKKYLHDFKVIIQELEREPTKQERIMDKVGKISEEQDQWTMLQKNKQKLEQIVRDNNDREKLLLTFGKFLLRRLESQMIRRQRVDSDLSSYRILKENNLEPLCHSLEVEYNKFQQQRTRELIRLVSLLETSKLNSLEELMELYQLIADELRSLGRGNLANQFDLVNRCLIEEQQLTNIRESLQRKSEVLARMDEMVTSREKALEMILSNYNEAIKIEEDHLDHEIDQIKVDVLRRLNFNPSTGVQTEDPLSFTDTVMGPLIFDRVVGVTDENSSRNEAHEVHNPKNSFSKYFSIIDQKNQDYAIIVMKTYWKPLMEWDLRCFVKILKQCPRISICLRELFSYFANTRWRNNETQMSIYGDLVHKADIGRYQTESSNNSPEMDSEIGGSNGNSVHQNSGNASQSSSENANVSTEHSKSQVKEGVKSYSKWTVGSPFVTSDDPTLTAYRKAMGITRNGFKRLIISLNLAPELIKSERTLEGLFHKYSTERTSSNVNFGNKSVRVITQELWIPLLRELAYINALIRFDILRQSTLGQNALLRLYKNINDTTGKVDYSVWENNLVGSNFGDNMMIKGVDNEDNKGFLKNLSNSRNKVVEDQSLSLSVTGHNNNNNNNNNSNTMGSSTDSGGHISTPGVAVTQDNIKELNRVTAFRHFCELHLIPLYKQVYGSEDFSTMLMLPFSKILYSEHDEFLRGLDIDPNDGRMSGIRGSILGLGDNADNGLLGNKKGYLTSQSTHEKVECDVNNCLKIVVSQLKMNIASAIFIQLASKSMKEFEYDITRELVEFKRKSNDDDILKNYFVTEFDYIKPLHLYEYLTNVGIIPGHISGNEMHSIVEKVLSSRDEYLPKQLPVTYKRSKSLSFPGYIETLSMCIAKGIVRKLSGSLWSEGDIRTEVIEHLVLFNLYDTTRI